jgi:hypothetical protein
MERWHQHGFVQIEVFFTASSAVDISFSIATRALIHVFLSADIWLELFLLLRLIFKFNFRDNSGTILKLMLKKI